MMMTLQLKKELGEVEAESANADCEIEGLQNRYVEDHDKMGTELEKLCGSLDFIESQPEKAKDDLDIDTSRLLDAEEHGSKFKLLEMSQQIEKNKTTLKSLHDLDDIYRRFEAVEKIEDALSGVKVIEIEGNCIRLSLKTYIPFLESVLRQQDIEIVIEPLETDHEIIIEITDGTLELNSVEIFPNDVYIGQIIDAAKSYRQLYSTFSVAEMGSSLEWLVRGVQDRIVLSTLRRFLVKNAYKSRHSFEYLNKDDVIVAHMVGGINAFIKLPQGWPLSNLGLELTSLKNTSQKHSEEISLTFLCNIVDMANSLNVNLRQNISSFADNIEETITQQMHSELHPRNGIVK